MTVLLAFSGKKQSGKGTLSKYVVDNVDQLFAEPSDFKGIYIHKTARVFSFAEPLKTMCMDILGLTHEQCYGTDEQKNSLTKYKWENLPHYNVICESLWSAHTKTISMGPPVYPTGLMTARQILQQFGTDIYRHLHDSIWAEACIRKIHKSNVDVALIDDLRFKSEVKAVKDAGGYIVRLMRNPCPGDTHPSETELDDYDGFDGVVEADLTIWQSQRRLYQILTKLGLVKT